MSTSFPKQAEILMARPIHHSVNFYSWGIEIEDPKNGNIFKVNEQRLKPFLESRSPEIETTLLEDPSYLE